MIKRAMLLKKLYHRSCNRGCKELDIIMGNFALRHLSRLADGDLLQYQEILEINDTVLYNWLVGKEEVCEVALIPVIERIKLSMQKSDSA